MEYFYDRETDTMSITLGDFGRYEGSEEVAPGVIVHSDARRCALGVEIRTASAVIGVRGLSTFEPVMITAEELSRRMLETPHGPAVLRALDPSRF